MCYISPEPVFQCEFNCDVVMDTGISILVYITYVYLYCLQLLLVILDSAFICLDCFMIIEYLLELLLCTGRLRIFSFSSQNLSYRPFCLYYIIYYPGTPYYTSTKYIPGYLTGLCSGISATAAEFESHLPNVVTLSSKPQPQGTFGLVAQWLWSHSPMKHSGSSLESSLSLLGVIRGHNLLGKLG